MLPDVTAPELTATVLAGNSRLGLRDRVLLLGALDKGGILDNDALTLVAEHARPRSFRKGDLLLRDGEPIHHVFLITRGHVTVTQRGRAVREFDDSGAVGLNAVLAGDISGVRAVAERDTYTLAIPSNVLLDLYEANFLLVRNSMRILAGQILDDRGNLPVHQGDEPDIGEWRDATRTFVERIIEVRRGPFFRDTNLDAVLEFARQGYEFRGKAGDVLWDIGDPSTFWVTIDYGRVRCSRADGDSAIIGADYTLGIMDAQAGRPRSYRVEALTDYIGFRVNREVMLAILEGHFDLAKKILTAMSDTVFHNRAAHGEMSDTVATEPASDDPAR